MKPEQLRKLVRRWTLPVLALGVLGAVVAYLLSRSLTPQFEASGDILVVGGPSQAAGSTDLTINAIQATTTAASLLTEPPLLQQVINTLHLNTTPEALAKQVTTTPQINTELVAVRVRDPSPSEAAVIANAVMSTYVAQVTNQNSQRINQAGAALQAQIAAVQSTIAQDQQNLAAAQAHNQDTTAWRADINSNTALLTQLTLNYSSFKATQAQNLETVSVAASAPIPTIPASPRVGLNTAIGGVAGLAIGLIAAAALQYLDQGLHSADDVSARLGVPCLGIVPKYQTSRRDRGRRHAVQDKRAAESASEAYRRLRTNILFSSGDTDLKSIVLTSVRSGEGKTCTAANLAVALASSEKRVLLIDADMRRPDQHRLFGKPLDNGMSDLIIHTQANAVPSLNGMHRTQFPNLSLITSGTIPPNPSELLASKRAHALVESLVASHDLVVIDTPPAGVVTDALTLAADASVTVVVVEAGHTNATQAANTISSLRAVGANVIGVVLNKARTRDMSGYYYQYGGYGMEPGRDGDGRIRELGQPANFDGLPTTGHDEPASAGERAGQRAV